MKEQERMRIRNYERRQREGTLYPPSLESPPSSPILLGTSPHHQCGGHDYPDPAILQPQHIRKITSHWPTGRLLLCLVWQYLTLSLSRLVGLASEKVRWAESVEEFNK